MASHSIKEQALRVMRLVGAASCRCPAHSQAFAPGVRPESSAAKEHIEPEYAFEVASSTIRYGQGVTREVGMDFKNHGLKKVCVVTDQKVVSLPPVKEAIQSLDGNGIKYELYDKVRIEPTDTRTLPVDRQRERKNFQRLKNINEIVKAQARKNKEKKKPVHRTRLEPVSLSSLLDWLCGITSLSQM
ncbi:Hydroxyacid-oxoacid transhydrogenase [Acropora cervicornis]|uniref:Hydroxyacid-oxoacid transhydrogenase n=1 Tax=Acropora cervicornis TaxID=6130 RepID=A0AAD9Q3D4_ACRCE|nr:Hydroxyacid-oxoacid transhydrogenase [Acropora cervicornis]